MGHLLPVLRHARYAACLGQILHGHTAELLPHSFDRAIANPLERTHDVNHVPDTESDHLKSVLKRAIDSLDHV
jgi:hypothetical protein